MLTIIKIEAGANSHHPVESQSHRTECWLDGWTAVPQNLAEKVMDCGGYCDLVMEGGMLTDIVKKEKPVLPAPPPTVEERCAALEAENKQLTGKLDAAIQSNAMLENCLVEMAGIVYA